MDTLIGDREERLPPPGGGPGAAQSLAARQRHGAEARAGQEAAGEVPLLFHALVTAYLAAMVLLFKFAPDYYGLISQEDQPVEWATVVLYLAAAFLFLRHGLRRRRVFDSLVGLYCLFVAGEEFSWGQRLLGLKPPKLFLEENVQQEINLHNFFGASTHDAVFLLTVLGYGVLLPLLARRARTSRERA